MTTSETYHPDTLDLERLTFYAANAPSFTVEPSTTGGHVLKGNGWSAIVDADGRLYVDEVPR